MCHIVFLAYVPAREVCSCAASDQCASPAAYFAACSAAACSSADCCCCCCRSEEALYEMLAAVEPNIVDMRVIKDKYTGERQQQPKHCRCNADAPGSCILGLSAMLQL